MHQLYGSHCSICLNLLAQEGSHCAHLIYQAPIGAKQLSEAVHLGMLPESYQRSSAINGPVQFCPNCHLSYFTPEHIVLSPPLPVLQHILDYLYDTKLADRKALHEVFDLLLEASRGTSVDLPDPNAILPYLGLFSFVVLTPDDLKDHILLTPHLPDLSILQNNHFIAAPANILPTAPNVARIFDVIAVIDAKPPRQFGHIPLSPEDPAFRHKRYWRLPTKIGPILAALVDRVRYIVDGCKEIVLARQIHSILILNLDGIPVPRPPLSQPGSGRSDGSGPSGGGNGGSENGPSGSGGGGGGSSWDSSGGDNRGTKRQATKTYQSAKKQRRRSRDDVIDGNESKSNGEGDSSDRSRSPPHGVHPDDWEVASSFSSLDDGSARMGSPCGTELRSSNNTPPPPDEENPSDWRFGPSFSTHKIVFTARAVSLV